MHRNFTPAITFIENNKKKKNGYTKWIIILGLMYLFFEFHYPISFNTHFRFQVFKRRVERERARERQKASKCLSCAACVNLSADEDMNTGRHCRNTRHTRERERLHVSSSV